MQEKSKDELKKINNIKKNMLLQIEKLLRTKARRSIKSRYRYYESVKRFVKWLPENRYYIQSFKNVKEKHITAYVEYMTQKGLNISTIKTDLAGIRYFYALTDGRNPLPDNEYLELEHRISGNVERAWSEEEINKALNLAEKLNRKDVIEEILLSINFGLRLEETITITSTQLKDALTKEKLIIKGKRGYIRNVPVRTKEQKELLKFCLKEGREKVFLDGTKSTHLVKKEVQQWIYNHRDKFEDKGRVSGKEAEEFKKKGIIVRSHITFHGLRHYYAQKRYGEFLNQGLNEFESRRRVSEEIGHHRDEVTNVYLAKEVK